MSGRGSIMHIQSADNPFIIVGINATTGGVVPGCIAPTEIKAGTRLILDDCQSEMQKWLKDDEGRFFSYMDTNLCMQAGKKDQKLTQGIQLYLDECDLKDDRQLFDIEGNQFDWGYGFTPKEAKELCVVNQSQDGRHIYADRIMLRDCSTVNGKFAYWGEGLPLN